MHRPTVLWYTAVKKLEDGMNVQLKPGQEQALEQMVNAGEFASVEEAVLAAVELLEFRRYNDELRRQIEVGLKEADAGQVAAFDADDFKRRLLERHATRASRAAS
jgi:Arc/MetJ-type ribon-helix-helix transcriptional regulator